MEVEDYLAYKIHTFTADVMMISKHQVISSHDIDQVCLKWSFLTP